MFRLLPPVAVLLALVLPGLALSAETSGAAQTWAYYGGDPGNSRFSNLSEVTPENVSKLKLAWSFDAGGADTLRHSAMECTPLMVGGLLYVTSPTLELYALDPQTGHPVWRFNPFPARYDFRRLAGLAVILLGLLFTARFVRARQREPRLIAGCFVFYLLALPSLPRIGHWLLPDRADAERHSGPNRGVTYWNGGSDRRIFLAAGHHLFAVAADTGKPVIAFGSGGSVDLVTGLSGPRTGAYSVTSPGVIVGDVLVLGSAVGEGPGPVASGEVRGFDVRTGRQRWSFHTVPHTGEAGSDTWPRDAAAHSGAANAWAGMSVDKTRGLVFVPTGSPAFDYFGGDRIGSNRWSDSLIALNAATGQAVWDYQFVHHDLWDYDLPCPPVLTTLPRNGKPVDVVVQPTKQGYLFVFERDNGKPYFPIREQPVAPSTVAGEQAWRTQPVPVNPEPLVRQAVTEADLTDRSPELHAEAVRAFRSLSAAQIYAPPAERGTLVVPGFLGGVSWGGAAIDHARGLLIVNSSELPYRLRLKRQSQPGYPYTAENFDDPFLDRDGYPAIRPPWGKLTAVNLVSGKRLWEVPLGEYPELKRQGMSPTGTTNVGGLLLTRSGVVFIAATKDRQIRAFDAATGHQLWQYELSAAGHASPATYQWRGKQYIVIAAGGGSIANSTPSGSQYYAFSLP